MTATKAMSVSMQPSFYVKNYANSKASLGSHEWDSFHLKTQSDDFFAYVMTIFLSQASSSDIFSQIGASELFGTEHIALNSLRGFLVSSPSCSKETQQDRFNRATSIIAKQIPVSKQDIPTIVEKTKENLTKSAQSGELPAGFSIEAAVSMLIIALSVYFASKVTTAQINNSPEKIVENRKAAAESSSQQTVAAKQEVAKKHVVDAAPAAKPTQDKAKEAQEAALLTQKVIDHHDAQKKEQEIKQAKHQEVNSDV
ncbi:MAG: hypothetical protein V4591_10975 [Bdellovibrionota bacterium]